jgi:hypothetical protein
MNRINEDAQGWGAEGIRGRSKVVDSIVAILDAGRKAFLSLQAGIKAALGVG